MIDKNDSIDIKDQIFKYDIKFTHHKSDFSVTYSFYFWVSWV